jgi:hypothetical protein
MLPGLFLNLRMLLEVKHGVTLIPTNAILFDEEGAFVWEINPDQTVSCRHLKVGTMTDGESVEVETGMAPGELLVTGHANKLLTQGAKIRYTLVQNMATSPTPVSLAPAAALNFSFGPMIERVVNLVGFTNSVIDLNSGRFVVRPTFEESTNEETNENDSLEAFRFNKKNSVDASGAVEIPLMGPNGSFAPLPKTEKLNGLACEDGTFALQTEASNWDTAPADWVAEHAKNIKPAWETSHMSGMGELPKVYLFKTREGSLGILQLTSFTENPRSMKIRYKLVQ